MVNISNKEQQSNFENMMRLAEYAADQHKERRTTIFRIFISYMTLLVVIFGLIMKYWDYVVLKEGNAFLFFAGVFLGLLFIFYLLWLEIFYRAADNDVRRRSFYLVKAQVLCYYMSKDLSQCYSGCKNVSLNLANRKSREISEKDLFKQRDPKIGLGKVVKRVAPPTVWDNPHFWFHSFAPGGLTFLIICALCIKSMADKYWVCILGTSLVLAVIFWLLRRFLKCEEHNAFN